MTINFYANFFCDGRSYLFRKRSDAVQTEQREGFKANKSRRDFSPGAWGTLPNKQHKEARLGPFVPCLRH